MKLFYYYLRNKNRQPFGCVCVGVDLENLKYSRGISLCAAKDQFIKKSARKISKSRCITAMKNKNTTLNINYYHPNRTKDSIKSLDECKQQIPPPYKFTFKSEYDVNLTPFEYEIIKDERLDE